MPEGPAEKVAAIAPLVSVTPEAPINCPVEVAKFTVCPDNTVLLEFSTVAVMAVELVPSLFTLTGIAVRVIEAAAVELESAVVEGGPLAPHPANPANKADVTANIRTVKILA